MHSSGRPTNIRAKLFATLGENEYRQDLRYWYGTGPGSYHNTSVMLPVIQGVVDILKSGPETPVKGRKCQGDKADVLGPLSVGFTHDNQINQMVSSLGIFDLQPPLAADSMNKSRVSGPR